MGWDVGLTKMDLYMPEHKMKNKEDVRPGDMVWVEYYEDKDGDLMIRRNEESPKAKGRVFVCIENDYRNIDGKLLEISFCIPEDLGFYESGQIDVVNANSFWFSRDDITSFEPSKEEPLKEKKPEWMIWRDKMLSSQIEEENNRPINRPFEFI